MGSTTTMSSGPRSCKTNDPTGGHTVGASRRCAHFEWYNQGPPTGVEFSQIYTDLQIFEGCQGDTIGCFLVET